MLKPRLTHDLVRLVLAWFVLTLTVAWASPLVTPPSFDLICTGSGMLKLADSDASDSANHPHTLDCPACLPGWASAGHQPIDLQAVHLGDVRVARLWRSAHSSETHPPFAPRGPPKLIV